MPTEVQFADRRQYPVSVNVTADGWRSTGIDWADYSRMGTQQRRQSGERRLPTPEWALNPEQLRALIVRVMELRACIKYPQPGTDSERLVRAQELIDLGLPAKTATLNRMCQKFVALKKDPTATRRQIEKLSQLIEGLDSEICTLQKPDRGAEILAGIVHHYYGACLDSVGVATELSIKPPAVRRILWSMHRVWVRMQKPAPTGLVLCQKCDLYVGGGHLCFLREHKGQRFCVVCGKEVPKHRHKFCGNKCYREQEKLKRKVPLNSETRPAFCSPACKGIFGSPARAIADGAQCFDAATVDVGDRFYETYVQFCARLNTAPMPFAEWATRR
jgi:hypothetical protein